MARPNPPFQKILIANRGEIAVRVIRACRELGIRTVAIFSTADRNALHVSMADESVCVGPPETNSSYRNIPNIISAAEVTQSEAIHPGYGFLSENAHFAEICHSAGVVFIGPSPESISLMGDKARAKALMRETGVPVVPGSIGAVASEEEGMAIAEETGFPLIIKASAGGGGRGMRIVHEKESFSNAFQSAQTEAYQAFGSKDVYIEKFFIGPHHVEIQILADKDGNVVTMGERDCSVQRRHQKLLEETPSPLLTARIRQEMAETAVKAAKACGYVNAGTVEFLVDDNKNFYFIEMNTRIQVEHPITEQAFDYDLVKAQILVAAGKSISDTHKPSGHVIECRINAEDPWTFTPSPGTITRIIPPGGPGIRIDSWVTQGSVIPPHYDSLIAKIIAKGSDRNEAIARMKRALSEYVIDGIKTTIPLHLEILEDPDFIRGKYDTSFIESFMGKREKRLQQEKIEQEFDEGNSPEMTHKRSGR